MKILLINPPYINYSGIKNSGGHAIPLNLAYIAAYTRNRIECTISILDAENLGLSYDEVGEKITKKSPDIIGITCPTPSFNHVSKIASLAKKHNPKVYVVVGGPHPTAFPEEAAKTAGIDCVVRGEGESTFAEIVEVISYGKKKIKDIKGITYEKFGEIIVTPDRELIANLDECPFPARDLFNLEHYYAAATKKVSKYKGTSIIASRGCPYDCVHCISKLIWKRCVRYRSIFSIIEEIELCINRYDIREFNFYDDTFTLNKKRVMEFCDKVIKRKLEIAWICFGRVNIIDSEMARAMKKAGCRKISFGLESGSQKILNVMRKNATLDLARKAVKISNEAGLNVHASFMLGNLEETTDTIKETIKFAKELNLDNATFFITAPFPGTDLYEIAKSKNFINEKTAWEDYAPITKSEPILIQDNINKEDLIRWQKKAFKEFYLRPSYVFRKLQKISSFDEIKMLIEGLGVFFRLQEK